jgi:hypothetical protein
MMGNLQVQELTQDYEICKEMATGSQRGDGAAA